MFKRLIIAFYFLSQLQFYDIKHNMKVNKGECPIILAPWEKPKPPPLPRRPPWFKSERTPYLMQHLPDTPNTNQDKRTIVKGNTWFDATLTRQFTKNVTPRVDFVAVGPPQAENKRDQITRTKKKQRKNNRPKTSLSSPEKNEMLRTFKVRLRPTREQKLFFQQCFSVAVLAKQLAYKHLGDQKITMTGKRMKELKKKICTVKIQTRKYKEGQVNNNKHDGDEANCKPKKVIDPRKRKFQILSKTVNTTVPAYLRRRLYNPEVRADVRNNAVISFCRAVAATQAFMKERQIEWDMKMAAYNRQAKQREEYESQCITDEHSLLADPEFSQFSERVYNMKEQEMKKQLKKKVTSFLLKRKRTNLKDEDKVQRVKMPKARPPSRERPEMKSDQVKPPTRNDPTLSFQMDVQPQSKCSISWDIEQGKMFFMNQQVMLLGSPSARKRQLRRLTERMPNEEQMTRKESIIKYENGRYYALVVYTIEPIVRPQAAVGSSVVVRAVALDPGVRTFSAMYDTKGRFGEIATGQVSHMIQIARKTDKIKSRIDQHLLTRSEQRQARGCKLKLCAPLDKTERKRVKRERHRARRKVRSLNQKVRDLRNDLHWKTARALCDRYDHIIMPKFNSRAAVRFLAKSTTRELLHWSHYQFQQRLLCKGEQLGAKVHLVTEPYTSITCSSCLWINEGFRGNSSKWFQCPRSDCGYANDRDFNAARNILLMNLEKCVGTVEHHRMQV